MAQTVEDYQDTTSNVVIVIVRPIVVDIAKTTVVRITTDQTVITVESVPSFLIFTENLALNTIFSVLHCPFLKIKEA